MKISEYFVSYIKSLGVDTVFGVQGSGTAIQMFDALGETDGIKYVCTLHEQAAGMAADAYAEISEKFGVCVATCGPGAGNLFTCIAGSYYNSNPVIYIVGQPPTDLLSKVEGLRHYGYHENNLNAFYPVCKYVTQILDKNSARYEFEKAIYIATHNRPGPVVVAIPDDITWLQIDPENQKGYAPEKQTNVIKENDIKLIIELFQNSERPVIIAGKGIKCSRAVEEFREFVKRINCPVALTWGAKDLLSYNNPLNVGSFGVQGSRSGNFTVQNADFILSIGTRLDPSETGVPQNNFARGAKIASVDIDVCELETYSAYGLKVHKTIQSDAGAFLKAMCEFTDNINIKSYDSWLIKTSLWKEKYPIVQDEYYKEREVNPYVFINELSKTSKNSCIITDTSTPRNYIFQAFKNQFNQRMHTWLNYACLGYGLPAGIGACFAHKGSVVTIMGDGGLQFNIQELATIAYHKLILKIIVLDNGGFANIFHVQNNYMNGRHHGIDKAHGLPMPDSVKIASAYGLPVIEISSNQEMQNKLEALFATDNPVFCVIKLPMKHWVVPRKNGKDPIEDMSPKLDRKDFYNEMIIDPIT